MKPITTEKRLGSIKDVAARLDVTERWVWKALADGKFGPRHIRLGRSVKFDLDEIDRWINAGCPPRDRWPALRDGQKEGA